MYLFESLREVASSYLSEEHVTLLRDAYILGKDAHEGQFRSSGEPYITHPLAVARILAELKLDHQTLAAAVLHDTIEDTPVTYEQLQEQFGTEIADLVEGVSKLDKIKFRDKKEAQVENFRKMMMAMVQDIRVILIKLADRTHNMRTLGSLRPDKRRRIARETLEIYAPIANRLGIHSIKNELEELGFEALYPMRYRVLKESVKNARGNRKELINGIHQELQGRIEEAGIEADVSGREKNLYSIYKKMVSKELQFHEVMDIYAFRIIVDSLDTCYRALGLSHSLYKPRPGRFKDYVAIPKANGYQSLHTSLVGPHGVPVEVQIRTEHMDQMADKGVAAHWSYKQTDESSSTTAQIRAQRWMQSLLELQQSAGSSFEFIENVKTDLFPDEIYVFTPEGKIIELPTGATPVDFAYAVHTDVGHACVGARVNRHPFPLSKALSNGQTIEVITAPGARPNAAWLNFVVTGKARGKIRQLLKNQRREESVNLGRRLLNHALGSVKLDKINPESLEQVLKDLKAESLNDLLAEIGLGNAMSIVVARRLLGNTDELSHQSKGKIAIQGAEGLLLTYGNCCRPIPGDPVVAHISQGKGLVVHLEACKNISGYQKEPDRYINVDWSKDAAAEAEYKTEMRIDMVNHQGILASLTNVVASTGANIVNIVTEEKEGRVYTVDLLVTTHSRIHLADIMRKIRVMPEVLRVVRLRNK
ncbi:MULTISPECIES: bifunctional GTP diphosphokinase/guanosine-3',5'-bis pyrophosphate 3'-pyrophosphohydrolase [unclassified Agarivorans]|uniref:bifunctional GTP diphosphokinase/guanosine-3',5'-bis pyrophosphate 3'-pyrophosphohydrolase n=1 Tax=unclassified Agarivorans TaxID=2636026 RepID=UPI0026E297DB|nr:MULTISPECIES: bifunctional GTP diphosphokinase/guanosine-3',5'-bis pyrophosphate 3'-pyrophosphohydrolase [unclassified Agarivorans]MDO6685786.1 bifunctional GTP diphosphokinase/guanosine-3',5'-bis pyrophosphate 3'-pyrophosphohydrolase [Agarivorans sp. 3_MG-2023]MDO6716099.1 bifunctional GTP diphosphokinase/guanosine-3',5'-bis pyrophosphate 3'-pyrophosphohydrolase [Agarivorans sp. 2_MG-2023]MDO6764265.1 bifunctional GTP diphosphokinase/guanosine-3',5'-bis pyrophosphate 3'-pyrophosphohydrolase 